MYDKFRDKLSNMTFVGIYSASSSRLFHHKTSLASFRRIGSQKIRLRRRADANPQYRRAGRCHPNAPRKGRFHESEIDP
jgi:hypothetical protein